MSRIRKPQQLLFLYKDKIVTLFHKKFYAILLSRFAFGENAVALLTKGFPRSVKKFINKLMNILGYHALVDGLDFDMYAIGKDCVRDFDLFGLANN